MRLLLLRHGIAADAGPAPDDRDGSRPLTPEGAERMRTQARGMARLGIAADAVVCSPLTRCRQTADIVAEAIGADVRSDAGLAPGADLDAVEEALRAHPDADAVLVCGHQPDLSRIVADLTGGAVVGFGRGTLAVLDLTRPRPGGGRLRALYPAAALRLIGGG
jgi:phosphohistidine phosphatase